MERLKHEIVRESPIVMSRNDIAARMNVQPGSVDYWRKTIPDFPVAVSFTGAKGTTARKSFLKLSVMHWIHSLFARRGDPLAGALAARLQLSLQADYSVVPGCDELGEAEFRPVVITREGIGAMFNVSSATVDYWRREIEDFPVCISLTGNDAPHSHKVFDRDSVVYWALKRFAAAGDACAQALVARRERALKAANISLPLTTPTLTGA